ncbi:MAG: hypothetical protein FWD90_05605 [Defluviitaleaceae bacterium]|nr:hypothetical protein [Defluviitaleaceae bacterium]
MKNLKKKVALLLAVVMMLSLMPMNVFGFTNPSNRLLTNDEGSLTTLQLVINPALLNGFRTGNTAGVSNHIEITLTGRGGDTGFSLASTNITGAAITGGDFAGAQWHLVDRTTVRINLPEMGLLTNPTAGAVTILMPNISWPEGRESSDWNAQVTARFGETVLYTGRVFTNLPPAGVHGVNFTIDPVLFGGGVQTVANLRNLTLAERNVGSFGADGGTLTVRLFAPADYEWQAPGTNVTLQSNNLTRSGATLTSATRNPVVSEVALGNNVMQLTINVGNRIGTSLGQIVVEGLRLVASISNPRPVEDLNVRMRAQTTVGGGLTSNEDRWNANPLVAQRRVGGFTTTVIPETAPLLDSGLSDGFNSATISIASNAPGSFMVNQHVFVDFNQPGVEVIGARYRIFTTADGRPGANDGWTSASNEVIVDPEGDRVRITTGNTGNTTANRTMEIQFELRIAPGIVARDAVESVTASLNMRGNYDDINRNLTVARVRDPIALSADTPVAVSTIGDVFGFIPPTAVADVTIDEAAVGLLEAGQFLYVYVIPTINGRVLPNLFGSDIRFDLDPVPTTTGNLRLSRVQRDRNVGTDFTGIQVHRFRVDEESRGSTPGTITFTGIEIGGSLLHARLPEVEFVFVVSGNAVADTVPAGTTHRLNHDDGRMPYSVVVATIAETEPDTPHTNEPPAQPPVQPPAQPPVVEPPVVNEPARLTVDTAQRNSAGQPIFITSGNDTLVNLRGLFADVVPNGTVIRGDRVSTFSAPHANGPMINIIIPDGDTPAVRSAGLLEPTAIVASYGFVAIDGTWYVPMSVFTSLLGYLIN